MNETKPSYFFKYEIRPRVLARDNFRCVKCGKFGIQDAKTLEIHHIIPKKNGGSDELSNLMTLCRKCHRCVERGLDPAEFVPIVNKILACGVPLRMYDTFKMICERKQTGMGVVLREIINEFIKREKEYHVAM